MADNKKTKIIIGVIIGILLIAMVVVGIIFARSTIVEVSGTKEHKKEEVASEDIKEDESSEDTKDADSGDTDAKKESLERADYIAAYKDLLENYDSYEDKTWYWMDTPHDQEKLTFTIVDFGEENMPILLTGYDEYVKPVQGNGKYMVWVYDGKPFFKDNEYDYSELRYADNTLDCYSLEIFPESKKILAHTSLIECFGFTDSDEEIWEPLICSMYSVGTEGIKQEDYAYIKYTLDWDSGNFESWYGPYISVNYDPKKADDVSIDNYISWCKSIGLNEKEATQLKGLLSDEKIDFNKSNTVDGLEWVYNTAENRDKYLK